MPYSMEFQADAADDLARLEVNMTTLDEKIASLSPERREKVERLAAELIAEERAARAAGEAMEHSVEDSDEGLELSD